MALEDLARGLPFGLSKAAVQFIESQRSFTIDATADTFTYTAHGYAAGDVIVLNSITTTTGISTYPKYYVISSGLTSNAFKLSATAGGSAIDMTTNGSATGYRYRELRLRMANQASGDPEVKTTNYEGDNTIIKVYNLQSIAFKLAQDAFPEGAHAAMFELTAVTANLPDSYTNAYGLYGTNAEQTGLSCGFWFEHAETYTDASGVQSTKTVRDWMPKCTLTPTKPTNAKSSDKPDAWEYSLSVTDFAPTTDVAGVALPVTGAPVIRMTK
jgi:hypothetical protein